MIGETSEYWIIAVGGYIQGPGFTNYATACERFQELHEERAGEHLVLQHHRVETVAEVIS